MLYGENPIMALLARDLGMGAVLGPLTPDAIIACASERGAVEVITQFGGESSLSPLSPPDGAGVPGAGPLLDLASFRGSCLREMRLFSEAKPRIIAEEEIATLEQALEWAEDVGYPHIVYPAGPRGSRRTSIVYGPEDLRVYFREVIAPAEETLTIRPLYEDGTEVMVEAVAERGGTVILGLSQNLEDAGSAADDCMLAMPPLSLTAEQVQKVISYLSAIIEELSIEGNLRARVVLKDETIRLEELYLAPPRPFPRYRHRQAGAGVGYPGHPGAAFGRCLRGGFPRARHGPAPYHHPRTHRRRGRYPARLHATFLRLGGGARPRSGKRFRQGPDGRDELPAG